jgi:threonine synthase
MTESITLYCPLCDRYYQPAEGLWGCPRAEEDSGITKKEHILQKRISGYLERKPDAGPLSEKRIEPYSLWQELLTSRYILSESEYGDLLSRLQQQLIVFEGGGFYETPLLEERKIAAAAGLEWGRLWIKDETHNITGSHKGRHLFATLLYLEALRFGKKQSEKNILAIYSCGNAALAASAVARAGGYELHAFVPQDVSRVVERMLAERGAVVEKIARSSVGLGDPCYLAFREAVQSRGWLPFTCSGNDNWSNIEGGETLAWEFITRLEQEKERVDKIIVQVGGGALARSVIEGWLEFYRLGMVSYLPEFFCCQPEGGFPFVRAYYLALELIARQNGLACDLNFERQGDPRRQTAKIREYSKSGQAKVDRLIEFCRQNFEKPAVKDGLRYIRENRREFMWAWDAGSPRSQAEGILDDITYDWYYLLEGILRCGGRALVIPEEKIEQAYKLVKQGRQFKVSATGTAGLAGLLELRSASIISTESRVGLFFTGIDR